MPHPEHDLSITKYIHTPHFIEWFWNSLTHGAAIVSLEGKFLKVNNNLCEILGYTEHELLARSWMDLTDPQDAEADADAVAQIIQGQKSHYTMYKRYFPKMGTPIRARLTVYGYKAANNAPLALFFASQIVPVAGSDSYLEDVEKRVSEDADILSTIRLARKNWKWVVGFLLLIAGPNAVNSIAPLFIKAMEALSVLGK